MRATLLVGLALATVLCGVAYRVWGPQAAFAAAEFGGLAVLIQVAALMLMGPARAAGATVERFLARWGLGMGLQLVGVVAVALGAGLDPGHFPPLPTAMGFLGVLLPLLFLEVRLLR